MLSFIALSKISLRPTLASPVIYKFLNPADVEMMQNSETPSPRHRLLSRLKGTLSEELQHFRLKLLLLLQFKAFIIDRAAMGDWKDKNLQMFGGDVEKKIKGAP